MANTPRISVCMATYNGARWVKEQIDSILAQIGPDDELIIVDDCSTDNTLEIIKAIADPRIKLSQHPKNQGYIKTFERALEQAHGEYIFLSDQDDVWIPGRVEPMVAALANGADVVATNLATLDGPDSVTGPLGQKDWRLLARDSHHRVGNVLASLVGTMSYWGCAMAIRRSALARILPFPDYLIESHDVWISLYGNMLGKMEHLEIRSLRWRRHDNNTSPRKVRGPVQLAKIRWMFFRSVITLLRRRHITATDVSASQHSVLSEKLNHKYTHSFVVCAYKESPYLTACLDSLKKQTRKSEIIIATSTPSPFLTEVAAQYQVPLHVGNHQSGIGRDWNYAYAQATTDFVTIAHQDDLYAPVYTERVMAAAEAAKDPIMVFTEAIEQRGDEVVTKSTLLRTKRLMNAPLTPKFTQNWRWVRKLIYAFGCPSSIPTVAYNRNKMPDLQFDTEMKTNLDWDILERMAQLPGAFVYVRQPLVKHRIHPQSETSAGIEQGYRRTEDYEMYQRYWPKPIAKLLTKLYAISYTSNSVKQS